ncbi:YjjG family noncanonical pyrimidine nucleotidase [Thermoflexibacter ruber]|uniref:Putative hydrolase of the HAD superfamily n=1 Tax=Thermoflexibacter ruber TaxID=1003 RepID=A0A1I2GEV7_9BACT|nr:YjjG family noncanonical pyrimidine nucleotidase [Thermoflexibacter ruber]SFF16105.1 putative hydrolase of the HAD superfamily [Thermoflexibacter ruber]
MSKKYQHLFFDLDHTLWDFEKNSEETLKELFDELALQELLKVDFPIFMQCFRKINHALWDAYNHHQTDRKTIRTQRFELIRKELDCPPSEVFEQMNHAYLERCPQKPHLIPHSLEVLEYLQSDYILHIISNGFEEVQKQKMQSSGILHFFAEIITSETTQYRKPSKEIFEFALGKIQTTKADTLMIGDNLTTDIAGANNAGIDAVFYNPERLIHNEPITFEITSLKEIKTIL